MPQFDRTTIGGSRWTPPKDTKDTHRCATTINENLFNLRTAPFDAPTRYLWSYIEFFNNKWNFNIKLSALFPRTRPLLIQIN